jgi:transcriptional regulator with XRE-family HTH domain
MATKDPSAINTAYKEALVRLGERILLGRRRLALTQEDLAQECNAKQIVSLSRSRISDIENGVREPTYLEIQAIASVMGKDVNEFIV